LFGEAGTGYVALGYGLLAADGTAKAVPVRSQARAEPERFLSPDGGESRRTTKKASQDSEPERAKRRLLAAMLDDEVKAPRFYGCSTTLTE
jgi:hypothetical protein